MEAALGQERAEWPGKEGESGRERESLAERERETGGSGAIGGRRQARGRGSVPYLLFLLPVLHGRTEVLSPVCLPWAGCLSLTVLPSGRAEPSKRQPLAWAGTRRQEPRFRGSGGRGGGGRGGSGDGCGGIWDCGYGRSPSFQKWGDGEQVRGPGVGTGVGVTLENFLLSSLGGPRARETGQEVLKNPPARICRSV